MCDIKEMGDIAKTNYYKTRKSHLHTSLFITQRHQLYHKTKKNLEK